MNRLPGANGNGIRDAKHLTRQIASLTSTREQPAMILQARTHFHESKLRESTHWFQRLKVRFRPAA
jgi:hypothetical protein